MSCRCLLHRVLRSHLLSFGHGGAGCKVCFSCGTTGDFFVRNFSRLLSAISSEHRSSCIAIFLGGHFRIALSSAGVGCFGSWFCQFCWIFSCPSFFCARWAACCSFFCINFFNHLPLPVVVPSANMAVAGSTLPLASILPQPTLHQPFIVGPGFSPISGKLVGQIMTGKFMDLGGLSHQFSLCRPAASRGNPK